MSKITIVAVCTVGGTTMTGSAAVLLSVDLRVLNQITITATAGTSSMTVSGSDEIGVLLADFYNSPSVSLSETLASGDLVSASASSDGSPDLFSGPASVGLNIWSWTADTSSSFTAGSVAFAGSATWSLDAADYAGMLAGNTVGDIHFPASVDSDIVGGPLLQNGGAEVLGTWVVVPAPGGVAVLGLAGIAARRRR